MRQYFVALIAAMFFVGGLDSTAKAGEVLDRVMQKKTLVNAVEGEFPPFNYIGDNNEVVGFDIDVAQEVAKRMGVELKNITLGWDVITAGRWGGRWDITIGSMAVTKTRREVLDFPVKYYFAPAVILVHKDNTTIHGSKDLSGRRVGAQVATTNEKYLHHDLRLDTPISYDFENVQIVSYETEPPAIEDLALGDGVRLDAMCLGLLTAQEYIENDRPFKIVGEPLFYEEVAVAIDKGDPEFAAKVKEIVEDMRADGTLRRLSEERFGVDITTPPTDS